MRSCWKEEPDKRPTFTQICQQMEKIIATADPSYGYVDAIQVYDYLMAESTTDESVY
jgi:hypothetical protein